MPKKTTIEQLARMVKAGFDETASKQDLKSLATKAELQLVIDSLDFIRADIHDIKLTLGPLVRSAAATENVLRVHEKRLERLERKVGLGR